MKLKLISPNNWANRLLSALHKALDVGQLPHQADVVVSLGGGANRVVTAIDLYKQSYVKLILVSSEPHNKKTYLAMLRQASVPLSDVYFNDQATNTWNEAQQVLTILRNINARSVLIVTDPFHTRRARAIYAIQQSNPTFDLAFIHPIERYDPNLWWQTRFSAKAVLREYFKIAYYSVRYRIRAW